MKRFLLDTTALLTLRDAEPGADRVANLLGLAGRGQARCFGCFSSLMEVCSRVWRDEGREAAQLVHQQCLALPMEWLPSSETLLLKAAELKATHAMSLAHAWVAACAVQHDAVLVHKDPEFRLAPVPQEVLPLTLKVRIANPPSAG